MIITLIELTPLFKALVISSNKKGVCSWLGTYYFDFLAQTI